MGDAWITEELSGRVWTTWLALLASLSARDRGQGGAAGDTLIQQEPLSRALGRVEIHSPPWRLWSLLS